MTKEARVETLEVAKAAPRIVGGPVRSEKVKLVYPVEYDGKVWDEIEVRKITSGELSEFLKSDEETSPPNIVAPQVVIDALDAEDGFRVEEAANRFFPRRSSVLTESKTEPTPVDGAAS